MRIVGGIWGGRRLAEPEGRDVTRPTTDRVREAIASMLDANLPEGIEGARVLDAFAGSGAMGLEMLSRGAAAATLFEIDRRAAKTVKANVDTLHADRLHCQVVVGDVFAAAERGGMPGAPFDVVLLDPPYAFGAEPVGKLLADLAAAGLLSPGALVVFEHDRAVDVPPFPLFEVVRQKHYGKIAVDLLRFEPRAHANDM